MANPNTASLAFRARHPMTAPAKLVIVADAFID
jgi:hypothetical protein